jgi:hypothetical protein
MAKLALIGTFYGRYEQSRACVQRVLDSTRVPDEIILMCESHEDADNLKEFKKHPNVQIHVLITPKTDKKYDLIPYSNKINWALDHTDADLVAYLDNGSMPHIDKYRQMSEALENNLDWKAVYCGQHRTGFINVKHYADRIIEKPFAVINYTQGMHRATKERWTLDMKYAKPSDVADAMFWDSLKTPFYPVGTEILDEHYMEGSFANGL